MREPGNNQVIRLEVEAPGGRYLVIAVPLDTDPEEPLQFDRPWKAAFLRWLGHGRSVTKAAALAGVSRRHVTRCRRTDERFALAWESVEAIRRSVAL